MPTASTTPGSLNITVQQGDELSQLLDFSVTLTGYTFASEIVSALTGATLSTPTVTAVNLAAGQVNLAMSETQTAALAVGSYLWRLIWTAPGSVRRTAIEGIFEVVK
jgi:hypothetical protein